MRARRVRPKTGLAEGTPLWWAAATHSWAVWALALWPPTRRAVFGGSFWQYEFNTANGKTDPGCRVRVNCHAVPGVWQYEALAFAGLVMRWFRDGFCQLENSRPRPPAKTRTI